MLLKKHPFDAASLSPFKDLEEGEMVLKTASMRKVEGGVKIK